jgi:hypothetical protein
LNRLVKLWSACWVLNPCAKFLSGFSIRSILWSYELTVN